MSKPRIVPGLFASAGYGTCRDVASEGGQCALWPHAISRISDYNVVSFITLWNEIFMRGVYFGNEEPLRGSLHENNHSPDGSDADRRYSPRNGAADRAGLLRPEHLLRDPGSRKPP